MPTPEPKLRSLDDLLADAELYAEIFMRKTGKLPSLLFLDGDDGPIMCVAQALTDAQSKGAYVAALRFICIAHAATAVVIALESWATFANSGEPLDPAELPSEAFDRQEVVVLMGETRTGRKQKFLPIIRSDNGKFFGFGEWNFTTDKLEGRFAQIIAPHPPTAESRAIAYAVLKAKGFKVQKLKRRNS